MKVPRWTVYPALGVMVTLLVTAVPHAGDTPMHEGAAKRARAVQTPEQTGGEFDTAREKIQAERERMKRAASNKN